MKTNSKAKLLYIVFLVICGIIILSTVVFVNQYRWVQIYTDIKNGVTQINYASTGYIEGSSSNMYVFDFFTKYPGAFSEYPSNDFSNYAWIVYDFQNALNNVNYQILYLGVVSILCVCAMMILSNHNRAVYYKSNLVAGIILPLVIIVYGIIVLVQIMDVMSMFNNDSILFNIVNALQNPTQQAKIAQTVTTRAGLEAYFTCNGATFIVYDIIIAALVGYSLFMIVYTILRYKGSAERRKEILSRVVKNDD